MASQDGRSQSLVIYPTTVPFSDDNGTILKIDSSSFRNHAKQHHQSRKGSDIAQFFPISLVCTFECQWPQRQPKSHLDTVLLASVTTPAIRGFKFPCSSTMFTPCSPSIALFLALRTFESRTYLNLRGFLIFCGDNICFA